jgi:GNAT superfamily N-acetyltransferase
VIGKYDRERGIRTTYYIGTVDGDMGGSATGRADVEGNEGTVWVKSYGVYDALESILRGIDGFQEHISRIEGFDAEGVIFAFSEGEKKVLYHELSHVYDLMMRGTRGVSGTEHRWSTRPEEIEAELNALYNALLADDTLTLKDFEERLTPDSYGIGAADGKYDTMVGPLFGWARNHPEKVKISAQKILRRWVDMRQMVMNKLGRKVESRKFSDLMNEMPAWNDASKSLSDDISGVEPVMNVIDSKERGGFRTVDQFEIGEYVVWVMSRSREKALCCVVGYKGKVHVGEFDWYLNPFGWTTESAVVHPSHQGKGIAFGVYKYMIERHMTTLYSDNHLTGEEGKGSFDIWAKLGRTFPHKYVYDSIDDIAEEVDGFTRDMMGDSDKLFIVSTEDILE